MFRLIMVLGQFTCHKAIHWSWAASDVRRRFSPSASIHVGGGASGCFGTWADVGTGRPVGRPLGTAGRRGGPVGSAGLCDPVGGCALGGCPLGFASGLSFGFGRPFGVCLSCCCCCSCCLLSLWYGRADVAADVAAVVAAADPLGAVDAADPRGRASCFCCPIASGAAFMFGATLVAGSAFDVDAGGVCAAGG